MKNEFLIIIGMVVAHIGLISAFTPEVVFGESLDDEFQNAMERCTKPLGGFAYGTVIQNSTHYFDDTIACFIFDTRMIKGPDDVSAEKRVYENLPDFLKSPLKQSEMGIPFENILCNGDYVKVQKYDDSPACVKYETVPKLIERGWANFVPIQPEIGKFGTYDLQKNDQIFEIKYHIKGGNIAEISSDYNQMMIRVMIESPYDGSLQITIPRDVIDATIGEFDDDFFVLIDGMQADFSEKSNENHRELTIEFDRGSELIEIIGTNPDF